MDVTRLEKLNQSIYHCSVINMQTKLFSALCLMLSIDPELLLLLLLQVEVSEEACCSAQRVEALILGVSAGL